ncbi:Sorting nexin mvp1 [Lithohypha guttulata]|nr:Sorting nexin mvp1 [Lithohypha guttulata]
MSLFGESPPNSPSVATEAQNKSLFGDEPAAKRDTTSSSLFEDNSNDNNSPWSIPTPKKSNRQNFVKNLLPVNQVPDSYVDAYDNLLSAGQGHGAGVSLTAVRKALQSSQISLSDQGLVLNIILPAGQDSASSLERGEFNVLLALIGLAQEEEDIGLDAVDDRRKRLPEPKIPYLQQLNSQAQSKPAEPQTPSPKATRSNQRQDSFGGDPSADPWASPAIKNIPPSTAAHTMKSTSSDEFAPTAVNGVPRTTSTFTTNSVQDSTSTSADMANAWGSYNGSNSGGYSADTTATGGFGENNDPPRARPAHQQHNSMSASVALPKGTGELVTITILPDKEGVFLFSHHNYEVKTIRRGSTVVRRYSDFVWLLDCLHRRYPFRRLPLLPPKRLQVNGNHLAADNSTFLEKRRKGLIRFMNALVQHPVLSQETLVVMFLTVPTEISVWRKQATISVQEEFVGKALPPDLEDSLPSTLPDLFEQVRAGVRREAEIYIGLCLLMERLTKRNEAMAADNLKFSLALQTLTEGNNDVYAIDTNDVPLLNEGINATAKHLATSQSLLEDEARAWDSGILEDFKKIRDAMVSMKDLFDRRDRLAKDNIPQLERRIQSNETKLIAIRQKPAGTAKPGEAEKVENSITSDKESIVQQHARGVFIKECVRDEIVTFQTTIFTQSQLHQEWAQERVKYSELQASNWKGLVDETESMPVGE